MTVQFDPKKPTWVHDTEIYKNYLLIGFKNIATGKVVSVEAVGENAQLSEEDAQWLRKFMNRNRTIGFNSKPFDLPIVYAAIEGLRVREIKKLADDIILGGLRAWDAESEYGFSIPKGLDHIDLIEVAPGKASLKIYNGRLHGRRMQDLPIEPDAVLSSQDIETVYDYWKNDLDATVLLYEALKERIDLRTAMSIEYGEDLRSKSDAQVAEAVIKTQVSAIIGQKVERPKVSAGTGYKYRIPDFIRFKSGTLNDILDDIEDATFRVDTSGKIIMPKALQDAEIKIGKGIYRMGIGGLHSSEKCQAIVADEDHVLIDRDVTSYYPFIIINQGLHPKHLGWAFLKVYKGIVFRRIKAKEEGKKLKDEIKALKKELRDAERVGDLEKAVKTLETIAESLKITINGSFGKFGSPWSCLYSPDLLIQTTITGQLSLLMFIERLERAGIRIVSANTDGIVMLCPKDLIPRMEEIVKQWEKDTSFATEATHYSALYSRDVNNYIAVKTDGEVKTKGAYAKAGFQKNPQNEIAIEAVTEHIKSGKSLYKTVRECRDIKKFVTVRTVKGGAIWGVKPVEVERLGKTGKKLKPGVKFDTSESEYLGKAIRWYYSDEVDGCIHYKSNGNKVPRSEGARPLMQLPDEFPDDLDIGWYVREARSILADIAFDPDII